MIFKGFLILLVALVFISLPVILLIVLRDGYDDTYPCSPEDDVPLDWIEFMEVMEGDDD